MVTFTMPVSYTHLDVYKRQVPKYRLDAIETIGRKILQEYDPVLLDGPPQAVPIETIIEMCIRDRNQAGIRISVFIGPRYRNADLYET